MIRHCLLILIILKVASASAQDSLCCFTPANPKIEAKVNKEFIIKLRSCNSCGFHWTVDRLDTINVKLISVTVQNANGKKQQVGGDVYAFWKFVGLHTGEFNLEFVKRGPSKENKETGRCKFELLIN